MTPPIVTGETDLARTRAALAAAERVAWRLVDRPRSPFLAHAVARVERLRAELAHREEAARAR